MKFSNCRVRLLTDFNTLMLNGWPVGLAEGVRQALTPMLLLVATVIFSFVSPAELQNLPEGRSGFKAEVSGSRATLREDIHEVGLFLSQDQQTGTSKWSTLRLQPGDTQIVNAPQTTLPLTLTGIIFSDNEEKTLAIIQHNGLQMTLRPGQLVSSTEAVVAKVFADRVIIIAGDEYASLHLLQNDSFPR